VGCTILVIATLSGGGRAVVVGVVVLGVGRVVRTVGCDCQDCGGKDGPAKVAWRMGMVVSMGLPLVRAAVVACEGWLALEHAGW
jgi:hypothetical protein